MANQELGYGGRLSNGQVLTSQTAQMSDSMALNADGIVNSLMTLFTATSVQGAMVYLEQRMIITLLVLLQQTVMLMRIQTIIRTYSTEAIACRTLALQILWILWIP